MNAAESPALDRVTAANEGRASEYAKLFGHPSDIADADRDFVLRWARTLDGEVLNVGCGPGQWTRLLNAQGIAARGIDPVSAFVNLAAAAYPASSFAAGRAEATGAATASLGGVLAWYSLIHTEPSRIGDALREFARILRPGGALAQSECRSEHTVRPAGRRR